jgi:hypothetical protein
MTMKLLAKKGAFIVAFGLTVDHFSKYSDSVLIGAFKCVTILINEIYLPIKFCLF